MNLLFVCTGNTCRSPLAEAMAHDAAERRGLDISCRSAGLMTVGGAPASEGSVAAAARRGLDLTGHRSRPVNDDLLDWADLVLCMTERHARAIAPAVGSAPVCLVTAFVPDGDPLRDSDVADPFGGSLEDYERAAEEIGTAVEALVEAIAGQGGPKARVDERTEIRFAVLGDPVAHSRSPDMHGAGFRQLGIDASYERIRVPAERPGDLEVAMRELARSGGGGNVTVPHKPGAARALDVASEAVEITGACNCFWLDGSGRLAGDNTDVAAVESALKELLGGRANPRVLVLGAGGAAAAAALAAHGAGAEIVLANRTSTRATGLRDRFGDAGIGIELLDWPPKGGADVVVNATCLGMQPEDPLPCSFDDVIASTVVDLVYADGPTAWAQLALDHGLPLIDGLEILVRQGAACYPLWFGVPAPLAALRAGLDLGTSDDGTVDRK